MLEAAAKQGKSVEEFCERNSASFRSLFDSANIKYSAFIRTTDSNQIASVQTFWRKLRENGSIYRGKHEGYSMRASDLATYACVRCEVGTASLTKPSCRKLKSLITRRVSRFAASYTHVCFRLLMCFSVCSVLRLFVHAGVCRDRPSRCVAEGRELSVPPVVLSRPHRRLARRASDVRVSAAKIQRNCGLRTDCDSVLRMRSCASIVSRLGNAVL